MDGSLFRDRVDAGRQLAAELRRFAGDPDLLVLGLPRGGVLVAAEVAHALDAAFDVCVVRKLGVPGHEELAMGAIASGGVITLNEDVVAQIGATQEIIDTVADRELRELERREREYRGDRSPPLVKGHTVLLIDDGLATGASMRAAAIALRRQDPKRLVVAVPVAAPATCESIRAEVDEIVCLHTPEQFFGVGAWYADFSQVTDTEVRELLQSAGESERTGRR